MPGVQKPIGEFQTGGVIRDSDPFSLQENQMSDCRNVRFDNHAISKILGERDMLDITGSTPRTLIHWSQPVSEFYVVTNSDGTTTRYPASGVAQDITMGAGSTPVPLSTDPNAIYTASLFNGGFTYIVSDGVGVPQYIQASGPAAGELRLLPNFNYDPAFTSVTPRIIRPFRDVLVAANMRYVATGGEISYAPGTIRISDRAAPGSIPTNWDPFADDSNTAEELELAETEGIVDMVPLQNSLLIYTESSIFAMTLTGSNTIPVTVQKQLDGRGILSTNCAAEWYGRHFVVGPQDMYIYSGGASVSTVADARVRDYFYNNLNRDAVDTTFVFHNTRHDEMWVCYPTGTNTACNEALIWNYNHNTWSIRDLNSIYAATYGSNIVSGSFSRFDVPVLARDGMLLESDVGTSFSGNPINAYFERRGFDLIPDAVSFTKWNDDVFVLATGTGALDVRVRTSNTPGQPVDFFNMLDTKVQVREFQLDGDMADYKINPRVNGRYFNIRVGSNDTTGNWNFVRYILSLQIGDEA